MNWTQRILNAAKRGYFTRKEVALAFGNKCSLGETGNHIFAILSTNGDEPILFQLAMSFRRAVELSDFKMAIELNQEILKRTKRIKSEGLGLK